MVVKYAGRPPKFNEEEVNKFAIELVEWMKQPGNWWLKMFCLERDIDADCMSEWAVKYPVFRGAYNLAMEWQESKIVQSGMMGTFNSNITKFTLINKHNWTDKTETKVTGDSNNPLHAIIGLTNGTTKDLVDDEEDGEEG